MKFTFLGRFVALSSADFQTYKPFSDLGTNGMFHLSADPAGTVTPRAEVGDQHPLPKQHHPAGRQDGGKGDREQTKSFFC